MADLLGWRGEFDWLLAEVQVAHPGAPHARGIYWGAPQCSRCQQQSTTSTTVNTSANTTSTICAAATYLLA
jgi:hypothetical protein